MRRIRLKAKRKGRRKRPKKGDYVRFRERERSHGEEEEGQEGDWVLGGEKGREREGERENKRKLLEIGLKGSVVNGAREMIMRAFLRSSDMVGSSPVFSNLR